MYIQLKKGKQRELIKRAIKKAGSYRALSKQINIPRSTLVGHFNLSVISEENFEKIRSFLGISNSKRLILNKLENNWKQKIGGKKCVEVKKKNGTYNEQLQKAQQNGKEGIKKWHSMMKKNHQEEYYNIQYEKFKKIGGYKYYTKNGEKVRNILEKEVADYLFSKKINYTYEPLIEIKGRYFFPDFLIDNKIIIECTMWRGEIKAYKLKEKINLLKKKYKVYVLVPKHLYSYYKILNNHLIFNLGDIMSR